MRIEATERAGLGRHRRIGFHVSIASGLPRAVERAVERECTALQVFCDNPRAWSWSEHPPEEIERFRRERETAGLSPLVVHACYLINPCAPDAGIFRRSVERLARELERSAALGAEFYVIHPGSPKGRDFAWAIDRAADCLAHAAQRAESAPPVLLENAAGDYGPGGDFAAIAEVSARAKHNAPALRLGVAVDSCHAFASDYDLRQPNEVDRMVAELDATVGADSVALLHANDARDPVGSGRDRHWHIGRGEIGDEGIRSFLCHPRLAALPVILETPWETVGTDLENIRRVRALISA